MTERADAAERAEDTAYLAAHLQEMLASDPRVHEPELDVAVIGARVEVEGIVPTEERRVSVTIVLSEACPDHEIDNRTTVADYEPTGGEERIS
ncbi:MAG TPA: BON domain-containing protein [Actinomycetota bacterium]|nr:BON domain-containing protein [Actinomycetota bacterium]